jgi:hypothetical protein
MRLQLQLKGAKDMTATMRVSTAEVTTENAASYMQKLCAHWSHKFAVTVDGHHGTIELPTAKCDLRASETMLTVRLELQEDADEARMQKVVEEHLQRFGFREELVFVWNSTGK